MSYELLYIIAESVPEKDVSEITKQVAEIIKKRQGKVAKAEILGRKKIAYPIGKNQFGTFVNTLFSVPSENTKKIIRDVKGTEGIIRYLMTKKIEKMREVKKEVPKKRKEIKVKGVVGEEVKLEKPKLLEKPAKPSLAKAMEDKPAPQKPALKKESEITEKISSESDRLKKLDEKLDEILRE